MAKHYAIGLMSGTSLDGLDIAWCAFEKEDTSWTYQVLHAQTISYPQHWQNRLRQAPALSGKDLVQLHSDYGNYLGELVNDFIAGNKITHPGIIASHGHTVFHRPELGYTFQVGSGAAIAARTALTVVCDFRSLDVALNGQGAPLVPMGDHHLFKDYSYCLNLGGFANISFDENNTRKAFDICPVNIVINKLVQAAQLPALSFKGNFAPQQPPQGDLQFDPSGAIARQGTVHQQLLQQLNDLPFYQAKGPKSLGEEWVNEHFLHLLEAHRLALPDQLRTLYEHIAIQIVRCTHKIPGQNMLVTGGGAYNDFLISLIREKLSPHTQLVIPPKSLIDFKEALIFAFLGTLRMLNKPNSLAAVTGSMYDNIGGAVFLGQP